MRRARGPRLLGLLLAAVGCGPSTAGPGGGDGGGDAGTSTTGVDTDPCEGDPCCGVPCCAEAGRWQPRCSLPPECFSDADCGVGQICSSDTCMDLPSLDPCATGPRWTPVQELSIDAPGDVDAVAVLPGGTEIVAIYGGTGDWTVLSASDLAPVGPSGSLDTSFFVSTAAAADADGDGLADLVVGLSSPFDSEPPVGIAVAPGLAGGGFGPTVDLFFAEESVVWIGFLERGDAPGADLVVAADKIHRFTFTGTEVVGQGRHGPGLPASAALAAPPAGVGGAVDAVVYADQTFFGELRSVVRDGATDGLEDGPGIHLPGRAPDGRRNVAGRPFEVGLGIAWSIGFEPPPGQDAPPTWDTRIAALDHAGGGNWATVVLPPGSNYGEGIAALPAAPADLVVWGASGIAGIRGLVPGAPASACFYEAPFGDPTAVRDLVVVDGGDGTRDDLVAVDAQGRLHLFLRESG